MKIKFGNLRLNVAVILVALAALLYFFKLGSFSLYDAAETTYGEFVKNMLNMHDWLTLHFNGAVIFDKPPLYYWLVALVSKLIGFNEWAMRLPAAVSGLLTVVVTYLLGKKFHNERTGLLAGLVVMTAFQFLVQSRIAELDVVLTLFMTLAVYLFYLGYTSGEKKYYLAAYFPLALGMLIKGLLAVALPGCAICLFLLFKKELGKLKELRLAPGALIILLIGLPWYIAEYIIHGKVFLDFALGFLFLSRFGGVVAGHTGPWYYYFLALLLGFFPWSQFLPVALWRTFRDWRNDPELLTLCFVVPAFIVFSVAKTKIPNYILPLYPFLAIIVAAMWDRLFAEPGGERRAFVISNLCFAVVIVLIFTGIVILGNSNYPAQYVSLRPSLLTLAAILVIGSLISVLCFLRSAYKYSFAALPTMIFAITLLLTLVALPQVENFKGAKPLGQELAKAIKPGQQVAAYETGNRPSVVLHSPALVTFLTREAELDGFLAARRGFAFTTTDEYEKIKTRLPRGARILDTKGDLLVLY